MRKNYAAFSISIRRGYKIANPAYIFRLSIRVNHTAINFCECSYDGSGDATTRSEKFSALENVMEECRITFLSVILLLGVDTWDSVLVVASCYTLNKTNSW